jgi:hypothetical protein
MIPVRPEDAPDGARGGGAFGTPASVKLIFEDEHQPFSIKENGIIRPTIHQTLPSAPGILG